MSAPRATEQTLAEGVSMVRRRHESLEADFVATASAVDPAPEDDDLVDPVVSSNVHLPTAIATQLAEARTVRRLTNGEFIIAAIEATHGRLNDFIHPGGCSGWPTFQGQGSGIDIAVEGSDHACGLLPSCFRLRSAR